MGITLKKKFPREDGRKIRCKTGLAVVYVANIVND